jgi:hypothetical protein
MILWRDSDFGAGKSFGGVRRRTRWIDLTMSPNILIASRSAAFSLSVSFGWS